MKREIEMSKDSLTTKDNEFSSPTHSLNNSDQDFESKNLHNLLISLIRYESNLLYGKNLLIFLLVANI